MNKRGSNWWVWFSDVLRVFSQDAHHTHTHSQRSRPLIGAEICGAPLVPSLIWCTT